MQTLEACCSSGNCACVPQCYGRCRRSPGFHHLKPWISAMCQPVEVYEPFIWLEPPSQICGFRRQFPITLPAINERGKIGDRSKLERIVSCTILLRRTRT